ncbi:hypothetical protein PV326_012524 [Microctonus aethiopoides]|nr:hypothetical protein PV326_012524 [Microctonus aethiopoides]
MGRSQRSTGHRYDGLNGFCTIAAIEQGFRNSPNHVFDKHDNCGNYCKYREDNENYDNSRHMKNPILFKHVNKLFSDLADNAWKFVLAASSNTNESINNKMARYCPKANSYSTSESAEYRFACAVAHKNLGADYVLKVCRKMNLTKHNSIKKQQLRNEKEKKSNDTYSSDMTLLDTPINSSNIIQEIENHLSYNTENVAYVFFDLETGGFSPQKDILQIAMKGEKKLLSVYVTPIKNIDQT